MKLRLVMLVVWMVVGSRAQHAAAQVGDGVAGEATTAPAADPGEARRAFDAGVEASRTNRWEDARLAFQRSVELAPKASTFFNLAVVCLRSARGAEALAALDNFEQLAQPDVHAGMLAKAPQIRAEAQALSRPSPVIPAPATIPAIAPAEPAAREAGPRESSRPSVELKRPRRTVVAGALLGGLSLGLAVATIKRGDALSRCENDGPPGVVCPEHDSITSQRNGVLAATIVVGVVAVTALTIGSVRLVKARRAQLSLAVGPSGAAVVGRF